MDDPVKPRAGYLETPAKSPWSPAGNVTAYLSLEKIQRFQKYGPGHKFHEVRCVRASLSDPGAILRYNEDEWNGFCYTRLERTRYTNQGSQVPAEAGFVFLVFVTDNLRIIEWGFEPANRDDGELPMDDRGGSLGELIWRR